MLTSSFSKKVVKFHATPNDFSQFELRGSDLGLHFGTYDQCLNRMKSLNINEFFMLKVELNVGNTLLIHEDVFYGDAESTLLRLNREETMYEPYNPFSNLELEELIEIYLPHFNMDTVMDSPSVNDFEIYRAIEKLLTSKGFSSIKYYNEIEGQEDSEDQNEYSLCLWDPSRIKIIEKEKIKL